MVRRRRRPALGVVDEQLVDERLVSELAARASAEG